MWCLPIEEDQNDVEYGSRWYTKFDWLGKKFRAIQILCTIDFSAFDIIMKAFGLGFLGCGVCEGGEVGCGCTNPKLNQEESSNLNQEDTLADSWGQFLHKTTKT